MIDKAVIWAPYAKRPIPVIAMTLIWYQPNPILEIVVSSNDFEVLYLTLISQLDSS